MYERDIDKMPQIVMQRKNEKKGRSKDAQPLTMPTQENWKIKKYYTNECQNVKKKKFKSNIVGEDASVRPQDPNKYNLKTFEKFESDIVGVGVLDDPNAKNKHINKITSINQKSNIKFPTSNTAITLVALVITIIVLLILAGVTLNMVIGENGIFGKANNAKNKTEIAQYEEELRMCVLEIQTDEATKPTSFGMETIRENLVQKVKELENTEEIEITTPEGDATIEGIYKGYEFTIDEKYVAHIGDKATGIQILTSLNPTGWTQGPVTATITIKSNNGISKVEPDEGSKNGNEYIITKENITENTSFEYTVTDEQGNTQTKTIKITTIDKNAPADFTITAENAAEGLKITGTATDAESGIDKYEYYAKKTTDSNYTKYDSNPIAGLSIGTYSVYAIAYDKAGNQKQSNTVENVKILKTYSNVTAQMVANEPAKYYGLKVTDYTSQNGQNDWRIFYSDGTHIFLITGDYINTAETNRINSATGMTTTGYRAYWSSVPSFQTVDSEVLTRFKATEYELQSGINNSKCVSTLLNANNWSSYKDSGNKAEKAIGSPTVEMWMDSWNTRYPNSSDQIYRKASTSTSYPGYYVGTGENPSSYNMSLSAKEGYKNKLYYPHTSGYNSCNGYWLASPSAYSSNYVLYVYYDGYVNGSNYSSSNLGVRPVVSLNSGITVNAEEVE